MATVRKFMFDRSFDDLTDDVEPAEAQDATAAAAAEPEEPEEEVPTFGEQDVEQARQEGHAAGREQGIAEAAEATERHIAESLDVVAGRLEALLDASQRATEQASRDAMAAGVAVARKLFPAFSRRHGLDEIEGIIAEVMSRCAEEPQITIRVNDALQGAVSERVEAAARARGFAGTVSVTADPSIAPGDVALDWSDGGAVRDTERMWREIDDVVARNLGTDAAAERRPEPAESEQGDGDVEPESETAEEAARGDADG